MNPLDARRDIISAIGQETRIAILEFLRDGERCVCEIFPAIGHEQSNVSRHLNLMLAAGILSRRKEGLKIYYGVRYPEVLELLDLAGVIARNNGR
ncbi:MAG: metalloregulator ArsR/SmtB family transcription factor [Desulfuromonadales bacterium]|nr:metalloregulator ArsR/SmtB family transcription factor [Desulfuromonadales bacterium]